MDSVRTRIFQFLEAKLQALTSLRSAALGDYEPSQQSLPSAGILPDEETTQTQSLDLPVIYDETLNFVVRVVVDEGSAKAGYELDRLLPEVQAAVLADPTCGGICNQLSKGSTKWLFLDREYPKAGADLRFTAEYSTHALDPAQQ